MRFFSSSCSLAFLLSLFFSCWSAQAKDDGTDTALTIVFDRQHFVVQKDGSYVETVERMVRINDERGKRGEAERSFHFNRSTEELEIVEAYNEKPDGRRIPVTADQIKLQQEPAYRGAPMFQDMQIKVVIYSDVAVGDKIYSKMRKVRKRPLFDGQFADTTYPFFYAVEEQTLTYDLPVDMPLHADVAGYAADAPRAAGGRTIYRWKYIPAENPRIEAGTVSYWDFGRHLIVSTMDSYADLARAYDRHATPAAAVTPAIAEQARAIVAGISAPRARAIAIDDWVRKHIRYVAVYIGNGGVVPHDAESVLRNRYGDCKDHATLMEALLGAVGIEATPVLIAANNSFRLSPVASLGQFNHAITYVPALDLYLDSTAESIQGDFLPQYELDKQVVLTRSATMGHTPLTQPGAVHNRLLVDIDANGGARFDFTRENVGWIAEPVRDSHRRWRQLDRDHFVENVLKGMGIVGKGEVELGKLDSDAPDYEYRLRGQAENLTYLPGTVGINGLSSINAGIYEQVFGLTSEAARTQPFLCPDQNFSEEAEFRLPPGAIVLSLPDNVHIASPYFSYEADYRRAADGRVLVQRRLKSGKAGSRVCSPTDFAAIQGDIRKMMRDLRAQIILKSRTELSATN